MKRASKQIAAVLFASMLLPGYASAQTASDEQQIKDLERQWAEAVEEKDLDSIVALFADDGRIMPPNAEAVSGRDSIEKTWRAILDLPELDFSFAPTDVSVSESGDMGYVLGTYRLMYKGKDETVQDAGKYVDVWEKIDGDWKVMVETYNSDLAPE